MSTDTNNSSTGGSGAPPSSGGGGRLGKVILVCGVGVVVVSTILMAAKMYRGEVPVEERDQEPEPKTVVTKAPLISEKAAASIQGEKAYVAKATCDKSFPSGMLMDTSHVRVPRGTLTIANRHHYEMMVMFYSTTQNERVQAVGLNALENLEVKVPVGKYNVVVLTGEEWCSMEAGFKERAVQVNLDGVMLVSEDRRPTITFTSEGASPKQFTSKLNVGRLDEETIKRELAKDFKERNQSFEDIAEQRLQTVSEKITSKAGKKEGPRREGQDGAECDKPVKGVSHHYESEHFKNGQLTISPSPDGYFYVAGSLNGFPTVFSYAPSDPMVTISQSTASRAGIKSCFQVNGGKSSGGGNRNCVARVSNMTLSGFRLRNVDVNILPVPHADSVIGMNALREFKVEQSGSVIKIEKIPLAVVADAK